MNMNHHISFLWSCSSGLAPCALSTFRPSFGQRTGMTFHFRSRDPEPSIPSASFVSATCLLTGICAWIIMQMLFLLNVSRFPRLFCSLVGKGCGFEAHKRWIVNTGCFCSNIYFSENDRNSKPSDYATLPRCSGSWC